MSGDSVRQHEALRAALRDALEGLQEMLPYVPDYFVQKWALDGYVDRAKEALRLDEEW